MTTPPTDPTEPTTEGGDEDEPMIDPSTGQPFEDTPEGRAKKKAYITQRRNERHPHGGPRGQQKRGGGDDDV